MIFVWVILITLIVYAVVNTVNNIKTRLRYRKYKKEINDISSHEIDYGNTFDNNVGKINDANYVATDLVERESFLYEFDFLVKGGISKVNIVDYKGKLLSVHILKQIEMACRGISILDADMKDETNFDKLLKTHIVDKIGTIFEVIYDAIQEEYPIDDSLITKYINDLTTYRTCLTDEFIDFTVILEQSLRNINERIRINVENREDYIDKINYQYERFYGPLLEASEWVYVISPAEYKFANIYKVGMTTRHPIKRFKELNNTSTYGNFFVHCIIPNNDAMYMEERMHDIYEERRINKRREFFNEDLIILIKSLLEESKERNLLVFI